MNLGKTLTHLPRDVFAGTVVFLVALPLCLGIANASGVSPFAGLLAGIIGGLAVAALSGSSLSVSGPAAGLVVIVVDGIAKIGSFEAFLTAVLLSGAMQCVLGWLKAGRFAAYVPSPVIKGMMAAIGLLLIIKQVPIALGLGGAGDGTPPALALATPWGSSSIVALLLGIGSVVVLGAWSGAALSRYRLVRAIPGPLVVVVLGIAVVALLGANASPHALTADYRVALPVLESFDSIRAALTWPRLDQLANPDVWRLAATLAIVASLETLLSIEALDRIDPLRRVTPTDRELQAQGVGNMLAGALGALPITSVIVRSSVNVHAGGQTRLSAMLHGVLLLLSVLLLTGVLNLIPLACLAAVLIVTGAKLASPALFAEMARRGPHTCLPFVATVAGVLLTDLLIGIAIGVLCSLALSIRPYLHRAFTLVRYEDYALLSFRKDISFLAVVELKAQLQGIPDGTTIIVDATRADFIDPAVRELIDAYAVEGVQRGITVQFDADYHTTRRSWFDTRSSSG
jgi:MFS superfamily sulfate permease-like transporter